MLARWWNRGVLAFVLALTVFSFVVVWPSEPDRYLPDFIPWPEGKGIEMPFFSLSGGRIEGITVERRAMRLGLDLQGGTRIVLEADTSAAPEDVDVDEAIEANRDIIERRINAFGVAESEVARQGSDRLSVQLPGISPEEAREKIGRTALLRFCEPLRDSSGAVAIVPGGQAVYQSLSCEAQRNPDGTIITTPAGTSVLFTAFSEQTVDRNTIVWQPARSPNDETGTELTGRFLQRNSIQLVGAQVTGQPLLVLELNDAGGRLMEEVSGRLVGLPLAFFLDDEPVRGADGQVIAPTVQSQLGSEFQISGLSIEDGQTLRTLLRAGAFQLPMREVVTEEVDATLGDESVKASVIAAEVAVLIVMLFMILYYRLPGVLAALALVVYTATVLMVFKMWPVTLTLAGIAGFILSVGMAVDANILIFERMKEELRLGRSLVASIDTGFSRAWSSIWASNVSSLITCAILFWFGDRFGAALVKGFALTLAIGIIISMFTAVTVTRTFLRFAVNSRLAHRVTLWAADVGEARGAAEVATATGAPARRPE